MGRARSISVGSINGETYKLTPEDRSLHLHVVGPTGEGKTRLLTHMIRQDILAGHGVCVIDPTGGLYQEIAKWVATLGIAQRRPVHFIDVNDDEWTPVFNPLTRRDGDDVAKRVDAMAKACATAWGETLTDTPLLQRVLRAVFTVLVEHDLTLVEAIDLVTGAVSEREQRVRTYLTTHVGNEFVRRVWADFNRMKGELLPIGWTGSGVN